MDTPRYRWRRIGLPGLAFLLAFGNDDWIDAVYVALQLVFVFLGAYWLACYAQMSNWSAAWGIAFLLIPAVAVSLDRMTVDLPLAALAVGLFVYARKDDVHWPAYAALAAAPLFRETGGLLILAWCVFWLAKRSLAKPNLRRAVLGAACAIPAVGWWLYVTIHTTPDQVAFFTGLPFSGLVTWTLDALEDPSAAHGARANALFELLALAGIWLAFALCISTAAKARLDQRAWDLPELAAVVFAVFASLLQNQQVWASAYGAGRTLSPLLIALAIVALRDRRILFAAPLLLIVPRIALQFAAEIKVALLVHP